MTKRILIILFTIIILAALICLVVVQKKDPQPSDNQNSFTHTDNPQKTDGSPDRPYREQFDPTNDFITNIQKAPDLGTFAQILNRVGPEAIKGTGPFTVFAPTDEALRSLPKMSDAELIDLVKNHIVAGEHTVATLHTKTSIDSIGNDTITIHRSNNNVKLNTGSNLIEVDIQSSNGIIHTIDKTLSP